jgi:hypothetical protein
MLDAERPVNICRRAATSVRAPCVLFVRARRGEVCDAEMRGFAKTKFVSASSVYNDEASTEHSDQDEEASSDHCRRHRRDRFGVGYQVDAALAPPSSAGTAASFREPVQRSRIVAAAEATSGAAAGAPDSFLAAAVTRRVRASSGERGPSGHQATTSNGS